MLKTTRNKKKKHDNIARRKLNSIENKISEALMNNEINHEDFTTIINEEKNYQELIWLKKVKEKVLMKLLDKIHKCKIIISYCLKTEDRKK